MPVVKTDKYAFNNTLKSVKMLPCVKTIKCSAFSNCSKLENVSFSNNLKEIQSLAFFNCSKLTDISLPSSIEMLGDGVFKRCISLKKIRLPENIKYIPSNFFENCQSLETIVLPSELEIIGDEAFKGCSNLREIVFPKSLKEIKSRAFKRCNNLKSIIFPENLKIIGDNAFEGCKSLVNVIFNSSLEYVGDAVFTDNPCVMPEINGTLFSSSFMLKSEYRLCPTVTVPKKAKRLYLGFENALTYNQICKNNTCYRHILFLEKYNARIFISEKFYAKKNDNLLIDNNEFDFEKYDLQFEKADATEKPIIASFRLAYPVKLNEKTKKIYYSYLSDNLQTATVFATEKNEETVLRYITDNFDLSSEYCTFLYEKASKNGFSNLQVMLSQVKKNSGFDEIDLLYKEISGWSL